VRKLEKIAEKFGENWLQRLRRLRKTATLQQRRYNSDAANDNPSCFSNATLPASRSAPRFFNDNWIISLYMGMTVDLSLEWASYPAAIKALLPTLAPKNVKLLSNDNADLFKRCMSDLKVLLTEGQVTPQYVLDNTDDILNAVRRCNVALKWRLCHRRTQDPKLKGIIDPSVPEAQVIKVRT
jgi:WASH complex subunit strumpellin